MSEFRVDITEVVQKAEELRNLNSQLKASVTELESIETDLVGMWEGQARDTFHTAFTNDKGQMDNFVSTIEMFIQTLEAIASRYALAEMVNTETASTRTYK